MSSIASNSGIKLFDVENIRKDFPILSRTVNGYPLVYLDNAASSQKPDQVLGQMDHYYRHSHANVHRGVHTLSQEATDLLNRHEVVLHHLLEHPVTKKSSSPVALQNPSTL